MAACSEYEAQLREACRLVADRLGAPHPWELVFQSRSGPPSQPWLGPDVLDHLGALAASEAPAVALVPIGFVSDHMEVVHDLDGEAMARAAELGMPAVRAATVGTDPAFVSMIRELVVERLEPGAHRRALGCRGPRDDLCGAGCCPPPGMRTGDVPA
jgi:ferrochelatase